MLPSEVCCWHERRELYIAYCLGCMLAELIGTRYFAMVNVGLADKSNME